MPSIKNNTVSSSLGNEKSGFTLMEIMIVVVIVAILVAAAAPSFRYFYAQTVQHDATRTVATVLRTAQSLAVIHRVQIEVQFDPEKNKYQIIPDSSITKDWDAVPRFARPHILPDGVKFTKLKFNTANLDDPTSKIETLTFYANGSSDGGQIEMFGSKLKEITKIEIKKTTGNVIVEVKPSRDTTATQSQASS